MACGLTTRVMFAAAILAVASCCPPPEPVAPVIVIVQLPPKRPPGVQPARTIPPAILSRYEQAQPATPGEPIDRDSLKEPPTVPPAGPKTETSPSREVPAPPVVQRDTLPDEVVMRLIETGRAAFVRCFKKAVDAEPLVRSFKVRVHVELDANGAIESANADTTDAALGACLTRSMRWVQFPATGKPAQLDVPLIYRAE